MAGPSKTEARLYAQAQAIQALADELRRQRSWASRLVDVLAGDRVVRAILAVFVGICMLLLTGAGYRISTGYPPTEVVGLVPRFIGVTDAQPTTVPGRSDPSPVNPSAPSPSSDASPP